METHFKSQLLAEFTTEELQTEIRARHEKERFDKQKNLNINGITAKDFVIKYAPEPHEEYYWFSFYLVRGGVEYDIYYDCIENQSVYPLFEGSSIFEFVPYFLSEVCENAYESEFGLEETIEKLKELGFEKIVDDE